MARLVVPGLPHHITQRGNGRSRVFFDTADYQLYLTLLAKNCRAAGVECWAYCLMPNHIHLILVPQDEDGLRAALAPTNRRYAGMINARRRKTGHFWQGRYGAAVMDDNHLAAAFRYILRNPLTAKLVTSPEAYAWSSAKAYLKGKDDKLTHTKAMLMKFPNIKALLTEKKMAGDDHLVRDDETIGRPRGDDVFVKMLEKKTGRMLTPEKRGPKPLKHKAIKRRSRV